MSISKSNLSYELNNYIEKHEVNCFNIMIDFKLEPMLTNILNDVLANLNPDPYSFMVIKLEEVS